MKGKTFLSGVLDLDRRIARVLQEKEWQKALACQATGRISAVRYGGTSRRSKVEDAVVRMVDCDREADRLTDRLADLRREAWALIECVDQERLRWILIWRYVEGLDWDEIQLRLGELCGGPVARKTAYNLHGYGLRVFDSVYQYYYGLREEADEPDLLLG